MKPTVICLMSSSIDGRLHPSRYTESPDGDRTQWSAAYEDLHSRLEGDAWLVGRVTMAEMSKAAPHPPSTFPAVDRPIHVASRSGSYAIGVDRSGKLHFDGGAVGGDQVIVLLGRDVTDSHLAELTADGVSYIVAPESEMNLEAMLETLADGFGIKRLLLEGGGAINGSFFAAGLVDELDVLIAPALDGGITEGIVDYEPGLLGLTRLSLRSAKAVENGLVHLRYRVLPA
ncbi:MAG TPA: RibD family protein [Caulobacteraceae bacterium]|nr:RibD family protein [Caulobacteraceae bacterium]